MYSTRSFGMILHYKNTLVFFCPFVQSNIHMYCMGMGTHFLCHCRITDCSRYIGDENYVLRAHLCDNMRVAMECGNTLINIVPLYRL